MAEGTTIKDINASIFRDCLSEQVIYSLVQQPRQSKSRAKRAAKRKSSRDVNKIETEKDTDTGQDGIDGLTDFVEYLASEIFNELPDDLQTLSWYSLQDAPSLKDRYTDPLPIETVTSITDNLSPSTVDSLSAYGILNSSFDISLFLSQPLSSYITLSTTPPSSAKHTEWASGCEICERDWINLSYHHLIPREMHEKVLKRGWHPEYRLNDKASLCRQCHSMVHRIATNEGLARELYTVDLLKQREDVQKFASWLGRIRWKAK